MKKFLLGLLLLVVCFSAEAQVKKGNVSHKSDPLYGCNAEDFTTVVLDQRYFLQFLGIYCWDGTVLSTDDFVMVDDNTGRTHKMKQYSTSGNLNLNPATNVLTNTDPDQSVTNELQTVTKSGKTVTLSNGGGSFSVGNVSTPYSGTTAATTGLYTVIYPVAYSVTPNVQFNLVNGTDSQNLRLTSSTTTGFTVLARNRVDVVGLLPTWVNVSGASVDVLVTEK